MLPKYVSKRSMAFRGRPLIAAPLAGMAAIFLLLTSSAGMAQTEFEEDSDDKNKPWQESAIELPAAPRPENLLPFYVSPTATQSFAIDANSLSVGADGVIRYTLVATSEAGARNVSYEGIRCATYEMKLYAFGQQDGTWSRSRKNRWERVNPNTLNRQHAALAKDYFCLEKMVAGKAEEIVNRIRHKKTLAPQNF